MKFRKNFTHAFYETRDRLCNKVVTKTKNDLK